MRFIGHLDFVRTFQKIFRKSGVPIAFSEGFSPHPIFSIAAPLAVGVTGEGEYLDMELSRPMDIDEIKERLNNCCPDGLSIELVIPISKNEPAAMRIVSASKYRITHQKSFINEELIKSFLGQDAIFAEKESKSGNVTQLDLKNGIYELIYENDGLLMTVRTGSSVNIKPELVIKSLCEFAKEEYNPFDYKVHRLELYYGEDQLMPLSCPIKAIETE